MHLPGGRLLYIAIFVGFISSNQNLTAQNLNIVLGRPTDKSVTLNMMFDAKTVFYIEYGTSANSYPSKTQEYTAEANIPFVLPLQNLQADTRYFYRVVYKLQQDLNFKFSPQYTLQTWRPPGQTFSFTIETDPHPYDKKCYQPLWDIALDNQLAGNPDFIIDMGDTHGDDRNPPDITNEVSKQLHLNNRKNFGRICHSAPLFFCLGNHEGESGYYLLQTAPNNIATYGTTWRKYYFSNPVPDDFYSGNTQTEPNGIGLPENYYAWEWGDALFVVLDMYRYYTANVKPTKWDWTMGKTQYEWFKQTIENSKSRFKFVFAHHISGEGRGAAILAKQFEWGATTSEFNTNRPGWEMPIHQLMIKNKVNAFFQGHDHLFAREELDGLIYQEIPMPSDSSYSLGMIANADAYGGVKLSGSGHLKVNVSSEKVQVDYVLAVLPKDENTNRKNGQVVYSYTFNSSGITSASEVPQSMTKAFVKAWPNPFHDSVNIEFETMKPGLVEVQIYDINGKLIDRINAGVFEPGKHTIKWDAAKGNGKAVRKGIYNCVIISQDKRLSQKLIMN